MPASLKDKRIGEVRMQNCGLEAKIVGYRSRRDIDVQFPDGKTVEHRTYDNFKKGNILHPNIDRLKKQVDKRIGEIRLQNCGLEAEIVGYRHTNDIDVQFSDGKTVKHRIYANFKKGKINHPDISINKVLGQEQTQNCGLKAKIVGYRNNIDIDVQFPDGEIVEHKTYQSFRKGYIKHPKTDKCRKFKDKRIGETQIQNCGLEAKIVGYRNNQDIDVQFPDGEIVEHKAHKNFKQKTIGHPTLYNNFNTNIKKIYLLAKSKIYHTQVHGIACVTNDTYYYYCHCPICLAHEIWTFDEIKDHKCNHRLVQEREKLIKARSGVPAA